jgi:creatinine amidohydrolase/Fe(II)-dependent formamide hydrolase-like protein
MMHDLYSRMLSEHPEWEWLEFADLECGVQPVPGPGSRGVPFDVMRRLVLDVCRSVAELGAKRVVLMTFHGSPLHGIALEHGVKALRRWGVHAVAPFNIMLRKLLDAPGSVFSDAYDVLGSSSERDIMQAAFQSDFHGGFLETSVALHYASSTVDSCFEKLPPCPAVLPDRGLELAATIARKAGRSDLARELHIGAYGQGWYALRPFPGYTGNPSLATAEAGKAFARTFVELAWKDVLSALHGRPSALVPLGWWFEYASMGGKLSLPRVGLDDVFVHAPMVSEAAHELT